MVLLLYCSTDVDVTGLYDETDVCLERSIYQTVNPEFASIVGDPFEGNNYEYDSESESQDGNDSDFETRFVCISLYYDMYELKRHSLI